MVPAGCVTPAATAPHLRGERPKKALGFIYVPGGRVSPSPSSSSSTSSSTLEAFRYRTPAARSSMPTPAVTSLRTTSIEELDAWRRATARGLSRRQRLRLVSGPRRLKPGAQTWLTSYLRNTRQVYDQELESYEGMPDIAPYTSIIGLICWKSLPAPLVSRQMHTCMDSLPCNLLIRPSTSTFLSARACVHSNMPSRRLSLCVCWSAGRTRCGLCSMRT